MRRLALLTLGLLLGAALPASAQNWITVNGTSQLSASSSGPGVAIRQSGAGPAWCVQSPTTGANLWCVDKNGVVTSTVAAQTFAVNGIAATSTNALTLANTTASTASTTVQMPPNLKWSGSAYNSTSGLSENDSFFAEVLPATNAGTTTALWKLGVSINGGAATYPVTVDQSGDIVNLGTILSSGNIRSNASFVVATELDIATRFLYNAPPTITSAGTSPSVTGSNGANTFRLNVGTGGTATTIVLGLPTATTGWNCTGSNLTAAAANRNPTGILLEQSSTTASATIQYQTVATGVALAFVASDIVQVTCFPF